MCTCAVFGVGSLNNAPILCSLRGAPIARGRCGMGTLYMCVYSVRHGQPEWCTCCTWVRVRGRAHSKCIRTLIGMDSLSDTPMYLSACAWTCTPYM